MGIEDILESPAFYILSGIGVVASTVGFIVSRKSGLEPMPIVQFIALLVGIVIISAIFAGRE